MLEKLIAELTAALVANTAALNARQSDAPAVPAGTPPKPASTGQSSAALDYEKDVKPLALRVAKEKKREGLVAILTTFNVAQANLLKPEQFSAFITACNTALAAK